MTRLKSIISVLQGHLTIATIRIYRTSNNGEQCPHWSRCVCMGCGPLGQYQSLLQRHVHQVLHQTAEINEHLIAGFKMAMVPWVKKINIYWGFRTNVTVTSNNTQFLITAGYFVIVIFLIIVLRMKHRCLKILLIDTYVI